MVSVLILGGVGAGAAYLRGLDGGARSVDVLVRCVDGSLRASDASLGGCPLRIGGLYFAFCLLRSRLRLAF